MLFSFIPLEIFEMNGTSVKLVLFFPVGTFRTEIYVPFAKFHTSSGDKALFSKYQLQHYAEWILPKWKLQPKFPEPFVL